MKPLSIEWLRGRQFWGEGLKKGSSCVLVYGKTPNKDKTMSQETLYQWMHQIAQQMPCLGKWQAKGLALSSLGMIWSERSTLTKVAEKLGRFGTPDSLERRFQRWISNPRIDVCLT